MKYSENDNLPFSPFEDTDKLTCLHWKIMFILPKTEEILKEP